MKGEPVDVLIPLPGGFTRCSGYEWLPGSELSELNRGKMAAQLAWEMEILEAVWKQPICGPCSNVLANAINQRRTWMLHLRDKRRRMVPSLSSARSGRRSTVRGSNL